MRGTDPRQQAQPRPAQQIPQQQPHPQAQPQQNAAANLPAEQQKGESVSVPHMGQAPSNNLPYASAIWHHLTIPHELVLVKFEASQTLLGHELCIAQ